MKRRERTYRDLTGLRFSRLTVLELAERRPRGGANWRCRCDCGTVKVIHDGSLVRGDTKSCGCLKRETDKELSLKKTTHGKSRTSLYSLWGRMIHRCDCETAYNYKNYGGRGIKVCQEWKQSFLQFEKDMGPRPSPIHSIDRRNNDGDYCIDNCYWATPAEQGANKRNSRCVTFHGETLVLSQWSRRVGLNHSTIRNRLSRGWSPEKALTTPSRQKKRGNG